MSGDTRVEPWEIRAQVWVELFDRLLSGELGPAQYREMARDPSMMEMGPRGHAADPVYAILAQARHDANEFVPSDDVRDNEDMSPETLIARVGFAREAVFVRLAYARRCRKRQ